MFGDPLSRRSWEPRTHKSSNHNFNTSLSQSKMDLSCKEEEKKSFQVEQQKADNLMSRCGASCTVHTGSPTLAWHPRRIRFFRSTQSLKTRPLTSLPQRNATNKGFYLRPAKIPPAAEHANGCRVTPPPDSIS